MQKKQNGQSLLELATTLPLLFVVVFGVFDLGRIFFSTITLINAAREGVRYLAVYPEDGSPTSEFLGTKAIAIQEPITFSRTAYMVVL